MVIISIIIFHYTGLFAMKMTTPRSNVLHREIHYCVILENRPSSGFTFNDPTYPLIFTHNTEELKISRRTSSERLNIFNSRVYSDVGLYTIWKIPRTKENTIDLINVEIALQTTNETKARANSLKNNNNKIITIDSIVAKLLRYKVVYFINLPNDYYIIFQRIHHEFRNQIG
ncbi:GrBNV gp94-like protein-like protein [Mauternbach virus]|uniref:GrBNV gp94-like protein-like protein n=1 Tax=Mauternbach virus TaxID=2486603 RepID=A0A3G3E7K7_9VIRU|nr:GrBNV gp94-like protein-like protein [Mauternbach virus]AYP97970.1 GrBNV gp94-like protein-like protein [Mauternbach virus]